MSRLDQNGRAFAIYAKIWKTVAVAHESSSPCEIVKCRFAFLVSGKCLICVVARRLDLSCTAAAQGGNCFEH